MSGECYKCGEHAIDCRCRQPKRKPKQIMEWSRIEDLHPKAGQIILVYIPDFNGTKDFITVVIYCCVDSLQGATHWMHLPEKPK